jgi:hypothetical protein
VKKREQKRVGEPAMKKIQATEKEHSMRCLLQEHVQIRHICAISRGAIPLSGGPPTSRPTNHHVHHRRRISLASVGSVARGKTDPAIRRPPAKIRYRRSAHGSGRSDTTTVSSRERTDLGNLACRQHRRFSSTTGCREGQATRVQERCGAGDGEHLELPMFNGL